MKKIVLITGAAKGIGADCARVFAKNGFGVAIHYNKSGEKAQALCSMLKANGAEAQLFRADLSQSGGCKELVRSVVQKMGRTDVLVNNAGLSLIKPFLDTENGEGEELIRVNLLAAMQCAKYAAQDMLKRKSGSIVNVSSVWGLCGASCEVYYSASKAGMAGFTKALAAELAESGIRVNAVAPGVIDTDMNSSLSLQEKNELSKRIPMQRFGSGYDVAKAVYFLASDASDYITGEIINVSGGFLI